MATALTMARQSSAMRMGVERVSVARCITAAVVLIGAIAVDSSAGAEVQIGGAPHAVHLEAHNASIEDVFAALDKTFAVQYRSAVKLDKQLTGTYQGSLQEIVKRVLDGYSFVLKISGEGLDVAVLANGNGADLRPASATWRPAGPTPVLRLIDGSMPPAPLAMQAPGPAIILRPSSVALPAPVSSGPTGVSAPDAQTPTVPMASIQGVPEVPR